MTRCLLCGYDNHPGFRLCVQCHAVIADDEAVRLSTRAAITAVAAAVPGLKLRPNL